MSQMSQDMSQEHLINTSPPASPDEVQPVLPLAQGELTHDDPTESLRNPDIQEADAEMQEEENPSNIDETPELEEAGEDTATVEADEDSQQTHQKEKEEKEGQENL